MAHATIERLLHGMAQGDTERVRQTLAQNVVLRSPMLPDLVNGPDAVMAIIKPLRGLIDRFEPPGVMEGDGLHSTSVRYVSGDVTIEGMDLIRLDADGLIEEIRVFWRPLPTIVQMQQRVADALGVPKLRLVEAGGTAGA